MSLIDVSIIGAGPSGLYAAYMCRLYGLNVRIFDSLSCIGGQCTCLYSDKFIYDIPAFSCIKAQKLIDNLQYQLESCSDNTTLEYVLKTPIYNIDKQGEIFCLNEKWKSRTIIIATGHGSMEWKRLENSLFEDITCQNRIKYTIDFNCTGKNIAILGGGDSALSACIDVIDYAQHVYLIHRRAIVRGQAETLHILQQKSNFTLVAPNHIEKITLHNDKLNLLLQNRSILVDFCIPRFGLMIDEKKIKLNASDKQISQKHNSIIVNAQQQTNIDGIYAIGDVTGRLLLTTCFSQGVIVAKTIKQILQKDYKFVYSTHMQTNNT